MKQTLLILAGVLTATLAQSATVNWGNVNDTGFANASGVALPAGNLVRLGYFTISDLAVQALAVPTSANIATLNASWHVIADTTIGTGTGGAAAFFTLASSPVFSGADLGHQIYIWALNGATTGSATQQAIFYEPAASNIAWTFPGDNLPTTTKNIDMGQAKPALGGNFLAGSYQTSNASVAAAAGGGAYGSINLAAVPEPSTFALLGVAAMATAGSRRRNGTRRLQS